MRETSDNAGNRFFVTLLEQFTSKEDIAGGFTSQWDYYVEECKVMTFVSCQKRSWVPKSLRSVKNDDI